MEQQNNFTDKTVQQTVKQKARTPIGIIIVALLILFNGIGSLILGLISFDITILLMAAILIATAIGLRKMKRWGLYLFTVATVLGIAANIYASSFRNLSLLLKNAIQVIVLLYFWFIHKRFK